MVVDKYVLISITRYFLIENYIWWYQNFAMVGKVFFKKSVELIPVIPEPPTGKQCTSYELKLYLIWGISLLQ